MSNKESKSPQEDCEETAGAQEKAKSLIRDKLLFGKKTENVNEGTSKKKYTLKDRIEDIKTGFTEISKNVRDKKTQKTTGADDCMKEAGSNKQASRRMIYPYTISAKIAQFPFKYHWDNSWYFKYAFYGVLAAMPLFMYLGKQSYSPSNVADWKKKREELFTPHH